MPVFASNWRAVTAFLAVSTQWRAVGTLGGVIRTGLDYGAVDVVFRRLGIDETVWPDLQAMERAALQVWAEEED